MPRVPAAPAPGPPPIEVDSIYLDIAVAGMAKDATTPPPRKATLFEKSWESFPESKNIEDEREPLLEYSEKLEPITPIKQRALSDGSK